MQSEAASAFLGTLGLTVAAIVALALTRSRPGISAERRVTVRRIAIAAVAIQASHFGEETLQRFYLRFPGLLGLAPWSPGFFVTFNLAWLAIWALAISCLARFPRASAFPLWFLAIASLANGIVHPLLSLAVAGYFPGLWTSPLLGIAGVALLRALASATTPAGAPNGG